MSDKILIIEIPHTDKSLGMRIYNDGTYKVSMYHGIGWDDGYYYWKIKDGQFMWKGDNSHHEWNVLSVRSSGVSDIMEAFATYYAEQELLK